MIVYINNDGFLASPYISDATTPIDVSDDIWEIISSNKIFYNWKLENGEWKSVCINKSESLRNLRIEQCFNILDNRSVLWYNNLTSDQLEELNNWYQDWLNVTDTEIIPKTPTWLK